MLEKFKKKIKKKLILKNKYCERFGLLGSSILSDGSDIFENCSFECCGQDNIIELKGNVNLSESKVFISGKNNKIIIGQGSYISNATFWIEGNDNEIIIGNGLYSNVNNNFTVMDGKRLIIGEGCLFSSDINFQVGDGHPIYDKEGNRINLTEDITVGSHVWIGKRAVILKGSKIPEGCVIGTGAVVTGKFTEKNTVIVGVPAKIVKSNIRWEKK